MREFTLSTTRYFYNSQDEEVKVLARLGFKFSVLKEPVGFSNNDIRIAETKNTIKINHVDDLINLCDMYGWDLVFNPEHIEIYNDYRE